MKRPDNTFRRVGLTGNAEKAEFAALVCRAARLVRASGRTVCCDVETARCASLRGTPYPDTAALARAVDLLLVFGGDGTVLRVAREAAGCATPLRAPSLVPPLFFADTPAWRVTSADA